ncbi:MAG: peptidase M4 [Reinekea sp.]
MLISLALAVGTISLNVAADEIHHDKIRYLVEQGQLLSLAEIQAMHPDYFAGRLLDLEVEKSRDKVFYELKLLDKHHRFIKLLIDAKTGEVVTVRDRHHRHEDQDERHEDSSD